MSTRKAMPRGFAHITAQALVPEQLVPYVLAVSDTTPMLCGACMAYAREGDVVLVGYPLEGVHTETIAAGMALSDCSAPDWLNTAVEEALSIPKLQHITVLAPVRPEVAPPASSEEAGDHYWSIPVPPHLPGQKLRNMLTRARRECCIAPDLWTGEHAALVEAFIRARPLKPGTRHIFQCIERYLSATPGAVLFSARAVDDSLTAFCIGDFSSLSTAFYMFAFRDTQHSVPGVADALLATLLDEATRRGHVRVNLGLGINPGIAFFKKKWNAVPFLPYIETSWSPSRTSWWNIWTKR